MPGVASTVGSALADTHAPARVEIGAGVGGVVGAGGGALAGPATCGAGGPCALCDWSFGGAMLERTTGVGAGVGGGVGGGVCRTREMRISCTLNVCD